MAPEAQTFSFETVAALVAAVMESGGAISTKHYEMMATVENSRTVSAYEHQFRKVKARAKELLAKKGITTTSTPARRTAARSKDNAPGSAGGKSTGKRGRKPKNIDDGDADADDESPKKKVKVEESEDTPMSEDEDDGGAET